jgi:hypothetical protein
MQRRSLLFLLIVVCSFSTIKAQTPERGPSTQAERDRALAAIADLEIHPLGPNAKNEREWLTIWLIQVPDIHVGLCSSLLPGRTKGNKQDEDLLAVQVMFSSARYAIQHSGGDTKSLDQYQEGVEGALRMYEALIVEKPKDRRPEMDELIQRKKDGTLAEFVKKRVAAECKK